MTYKAPYPEPQRRWKCQPPS